MTQFSDKQIEQITQFHGHWCPGLAIGIRVAELALSHMGQPAADEEIVAICETDMCGVDAIQFCCGCTIGKGNLILRDFGKMAFGFYRRSDNKSLRIVYDPQFADSGDATTREEKARQILQAPFEDLFRIGPTTEPLPKKAHRLTSIPCQTCQEATMESKTRRFQGQTLCIPCFQERETR